jgi:hypothetical protein
MCLMIDGDGLLRRRRERWWKGAVGVAIVLGGAGCSTGPPTWYQDVAPMLASHCMSCHREGGIAPFSLTDFDSAKEQSLRMLDQIERGAMPPFSAQEDAECTPRFGWIGDPRLSESEKATLRQWIAHGHLLGDPVEPPPIPSQDLENVSTTLMPVEGWTASGDRDQFICYLFDLGNTDMEWLSGIQLRPGNAAIVHHALTFALGPEEAQPLVTEHGIGQPFWCEGGLPANFLIHAWFPGNQPLQLPPRMAMPIVPNAKIGLQIHYHPHGGVYDADRTGLDLQFSGTPPERLYVSASFGNEFTAPRLLPGPGDTQEGVSEFLVRKNVADHVEHMRIPLKDFGLDWRVASVVPHMHWLGTRLRLTLERPRVRGREPETECLTNVAWNFDWQRTYAFDAPFEQLPSIVEGDILDINCTWDNTINNPFTQRLLIDANVSQPFDVPFGDQTTNEMCLTILGVARDVSRDGSVESAARSSIDQLRRIDALSMRQASR